MDVAVGVQDAPLLEKEKMKKILADVALEIEIIELAVKQRHMLK